MSDETPQNDQPAPSTRVVAEPAKNRYALQVEGREVGFTEYVDRGEQRVFVHTEIDPAEEGNGYGSALIRGALEQVRESGLRAVAVCPFVTRYLQKHREFDDIVDPVSIELRASL